MFNIPSAVSSVLCVFQMLKVKGKKFIKEK
jgi:hypothetical protein